MEDRLKPIRMLAITGMILHTIWAALQCAVVSQSEIILKLMRFSGVSGADINFGKPLSFLYPVVSLVIVVLLFSYLMKQVRNGGGQPGLLFVLVLVSLIALPVFGSVAERVQMILVSRALGGVESVAALSYIRAAQGIVNYLDTAALPCLTAAAGMNWYRCKYMH